MCSPLELIGNKQSGVILVKETERAPFKCNARGDISRAGRIPCASLQWFREPGRAVCIFSDSSGRLGAWLGYTSAENRAFCHLSVSASRGLNQKQPQTQVPQPAPAPAIRTDRASSPSAALPCLPLFLAAARAAQPGAVLML